MTRGENILWGLLAIIAVSVVLEPFLPALEVQRSGWFIALLLAPVLEEFIFRGVVQRLLMRVVAPWGAILIASALFAALHGTPTQVAVALPCGIILGYTYFRTRTLAVPIAIHALNNALAWFSNGTTLRETAPNDAIYWIIYALCAGFLTINIIFVLRKL
jgi:membrane protease YdiL (CAAX protease family)